MKLKQIALAVAAVCAAPAAFATAPSGPYDTAGALKVFMSGATAPDEFLESIATGMMNSVYKIKDNGPGTEFRAFLGEVKSDASIPASLHGQKVLFIKRSKGGSVWGVNPVARAQGITTLKVDSSVCSTAAGSDGYYTCPAVGNDPGVAAPNGQEGVPDFGVSDVAPFMFKEPLNVEFGQSQLSAAETAGLTVRGVNTLMMGFVTTAAVPDSLYISDADYGAMLSGNINDWSLVGDGSAAPAGGNQVVVCRRWQGSGTQTSYNWFFNNFPCTGDSLLSGVSGTTAPARLTTSAGFAPLVDADNNGKPECQDTDYSGACDAGEPVGTKADPYILDPSAGYTVVENSGSGDVRKCLNSAQKGVDYLVKNEDGTYTKVQFSNVGAALGAIGVLSLDSQDKTGAATLGTDGNLKDVGAESEWFFRPQNGAGRMDNGTASTNGGISDETCSSTGTLSGVCPNRDGLREGKYSFAVELTMQYITANLAGQKLDFVTEFIDRAGEPGFQKAWTLALPPTYDPTDVTTGGLVAKATHYGNMCAPLQKLY